MVAGRHVGNMNIKVDYKNDNVEDFEPYTPSCPDNALEENNPEAYKAGQAACTDLNYDDSAELEITFDASLLNITGATLQMDGRGSLGRPIKYKVEACFANGFTSRRKWRKPKDVIQDDKRCNQGLQKKTDLNIGVNTFTHKLKSDTPGSQFFVTVFIFCERENEPGRDQYCFFDTTGPLGSLAKLGDVNKRSSGNGAALFAEANTSTPLQYKTSVPDFRTTGLVVGVIVLSICSVSMLFGYFTFERILKKSN